MKKKRGRGRPSKASIAARLLSELGASKGGHARAAALTPEERQAISAAGGRIGGKRSLETMSARARSERSRAAALARWGAKDERKATA